MCSGCQDVGNTLNITIEQVTDSLDGIIALNCLVTWTLPSGLNLTSRSDYVDNYVVKMGPASPSNWSFPIGTDILYFNSTIYQENQVFLDSWNGGPRVWNCTSNPGLVPPTAVECSLYPCVRTYNSSVIEGQLSETLLSTANMTRNLSRSVAPDSYNNYNYSAIPMPCLLNGIWYDEFSFTEHNETDWISIPGRGYHNETSYVPSECYFAFDNTAVVGEIMSTFFTGYAMQGNGTDYPSPAWLDQVLVGGNATLESINATWGAIADAMTVTIRQMPDGLNLTAIKGEAWRTETCISVQYTWLAFPAALLALTILLLFATIIQSARVSRRNTWKSSPLALLFHGLDNDLREKYRTIDQIDEMDRTAKELHVKLHPDEGGLKFVEAPRDGNSLGPVKK